MPVSKTQQWLGDGGILREYSSKMGQPAQIYCNPASYHGRPSGSQTTYFVQRYPYVYHIFVTNLRMSAWRIYLFYNPRATIEKNNREFLYDYPLGKIPSNSWKANVAFFQLLLFSANIVHWFKRLCLSKDYWTVTLDTIRTDFLVLPAKLAKHGSQNILLLPKDYHYRKEFQQALHKIQKLRLPENFRFGK